MENGEVECRESYGDKERRKKSERERNKRERICRRLVEAMNTAEAQFRG